ncbi:hypothetical protein LWC35_27450 [Pseudonocardia kujensis]|uniref:hypothetical protein n=1 Tax=Pseudonocardia kujensis TaxID=1128675 RepID=UPI001E4057EA|nr:hypothetical protein [Pseudonocardia kujensis]MCE0766611.1 hypothetical protein [Pseudonocardia kujensis]
MGRHRTRLLALSGRVIDAATAARAGLVPEAPPAAALDPAEERAALPPLAVEVGKAFVNPRDRGGLRRGGRGGGPLFGTAEHRERMAAFLERRPARPTGRTARPAARLRFASAALGMHLHHRR